MSISSARFTAPDKESVLVTYSDGMVRTVPVVSNNREYAALIASGVAISEFTNTPHTADDVRTEASKRLQAFFSARDAANLEIIIINGVREATQYHNLERQGVVWTGQQAYRALVLAVSYDFIEEVRAASNVMEVMDPIPDDYAADKHWPPYDQMTLQRIKDHTKQTIDRMVTILTQRANDNLSRYSMAQQAITGVDAAKMLLADEAAVKGISIDVLSAQILKDKATYETKVAAVFAKRAEAVAAINACDKVSTAVGVLVASIDEVKTIIG